MKLAGHAGTTEWMESSSAPGLELRKQKQKRQARLVLVAPAISGFAWLTSGVTGYSSSSYSKECRSMAWGRRAAMFRISPVITHMVISLLPP